MKIKTFIIVCIVFFDLQVVLHAKNPQENVVDYVNTLIGSAQKTDGGTMPSVTIPFGRTHFVAMTNQNCIGKTPYHLEGDKIVGFIATHQAAPWVGDYGALVICPSLGEPNLDEKKSSFSLNHDQEITKAYYYSANLISQNKEYEMKSEIAGAGDGGMFRFSYNKKGAQGLMLEASREKGMNGYIQIDIANNTVFGYNTDRQHAILGAPLSNFKGHFYVTFNKKIKSYGTWDYRYGKIPNRLSQNGEHIGAYLVFEDDDKPLEVKISTSFIDPQQAKVNYNKCLKDKSFEELVSITKNAWQDILSRVEMKSNNIEDKVIFYTAVYHTLLYPRTFSEDGKYYSGFDDQIHTGESYTDFSTWDTFRVEHPWLILIAPERVNGMIQAMLQDYQEGGWLPKWPNPGETAIMIGSHSDAIIADAYIKGFRGYDINLAYEAVHKNAFTIPYGDDGGDQFYTGGTLWATQKPEFRAPDAGNYWWDRASWNGGVESRGGISHYMKYGFVPVDYTAESVSRTIEFGVDDYCIAQMARDMGKIDDYKELMKRSKYYKNLYNSNTGFFAPRYHDGRWFENATDGFTEGTPWTYRFGAMHDVPGMIELMGGNKKFSQRLDSNFVQKHYRHDNEPGHHYIYLYDWTGDYYKTQALAREQIRKNYTFDPTYGINGNDDLGQMSAWYLFTAMGFYPVTPASGEYAFGAPQFPEISVWLDNTRTKQLKIIAHDLSEENKYVKKVEVNGKLQKSPFLKHVQIKDGAIIEYWMTNKPVKTFMN
jgi:putative alpha-1,2-mannosidase